ncbi:MAG: hypothetical protein ACKV0T_29560 [Planctomycetales bacterium]
MNSLIVAVGVALTFPGPSIEPPVAKSSDDAPSVSQSDGRETDAVEVAEEFDNQVTRWMQRTARSANLAPGKAVPRLVELYQQVTDESRLAAADRRRLQERLKSRLRELETQLVRSQVRGAAGRRMGNASLAGGGATVAEAAELIDLIQSTIAPESWDVNGGRGTIRYYRPLHVLVVRQTAEVHAQIGGTLRP